MEGALALPLKNPKPTEVRNLQTGDWQHYCSCHRMCGVSSFMWLTPRPLTGAPENFLWGCQGIAPPVFQPCPLPQVFHLAVSSSHSCSLEQLLSAHRLERASPPSRSGLGSLAFVALHSCPPVFPSSVPKCGIGPQALLSSNTRVCVHTGTHTRVLACTITRAHTGKDSHTHTHTHTHV